MSKGVSLRQAYVGFGRGFEQMKAELLAARAELDAISAAIGTNDYLDPPDGGSVPLAEQVARMAKDAARYRWLRTHGGEHQGPEVFIDGGYWLGTELDAQIDAHLP